MMVKDAVQLDPNFAQRDPDSDLRWYDIKTLGVEGRGWEDAENFYDRLPARAKGVVPDPVWQLSRYSAGMCVRFVTDATTIAARWSVTHERLAMAHMPATGVSGLDLYTREDGRYHYVGTARPTEYPRNQYQLVQSMVPGRREFQLYLPLYNGVSEVLIGIPGGASIYQAPPRPDPRPIVFYGTSIVQGGCASRPGMSHCAILGRRLNRPIMNLGFSGNGKSEIEVARLLAELDPCVYVLDSLANMSMEQVNERVEPFVRALRAARPQTPIVLVEHHRYVSEFLIKWKQGMFSEMRASLHRAYANLTASGVTGLHIQSGDLVGEDGEATVDGTHPTDMGFARMADAMQPLLSRLLPG